MKTDKETIELYKKKFVTTIQNPECNNCFRLADVYDTEASEHFCNECLDKELLLEIDEIRKMVNEEN
jgi:hypothetical protein